MFSLSAVRANQKSAIGLHNGLFNGVINVELGVADAKKLTFNANVTFMTGDIATPSKTFSPCTDDGAYKTFANIDDVITWCKGAFVGFTSLNFTVTDAGALAAVFVPPTDPVADALKQKNKFTALKAGLQDNKTKALAAIAAAETAGWNTSQYPALVANYNAIVGRKDAILAIETYYQSQITRFTA